MLGNASEGTGWGCQGRTAWWDGGGAGAAPGEAAEHIEALAVAPVQVQAEDRGEDEHHGCEVAANHDGRLGTDREGAEAG